jgi:hypothetical protein
LDRIDHLRAFLDREGALPRLETPVWISQIFHVSSTLHEAGDGREVMVVMLPKLHTSGSGH